jgi:hypothetical protein
MTAKQFVRSKYPTARCEKHMQGKIKAIQKPYYLIRVAGNTMYMAEGTSESNAWVNAKKYILENSAV